MNKGFCQVKKNPKIREKLGSGWVGQLPTRILIFFGNVMFFVFFCCFHAPTYLKKKKIGYCLINPSFSRIFEIFLTWQDPYYPHTTFYDIVDLSVNIVKAYIGYQRTETQIVLCCPTVTVNHVIVSNSYYTNTV